MKAAPRITFTVATRDVDGSDRRTFRTAKGALKRFESMSGYSLRAALDEQALSYGDAVTPKSPEAFLAQQRGAIRVVSAFGCVVVLSFERHELTADERERLALAQIDAVAEVRRELAVQAEVPTDAEFDEAQAQHWAETDKRLERNA